MVVEWLEFALDDPIIFIGVLLFITKIVKHKLKFHKDDFIFKIGKFSENLYRRFVSMFHYKKTIPLAIAGLLILHAFSDLMGFAFLLTVGKENLYIEQLGTEHLSFYGLYAQDSEGLGLPSKLSLLAGYALNALSFIVLLIIPSLAWFRVFYQKEMHFSRIFLPLVYSSIVSFALLPAYSLRQINEPGIIGIDVVANSLFKSFSIANFLVHDKAALISVVAIVSIAVGITAYFLSANTRIKKELYAISILIGVLFYTKYIYIFFSSLFNYLSNNIILFILTPHFLIAVVLSVIAVLSVLFYIGGYLMFVYELVMEYHKRKWSEPIDEELVRVITKIRSAERKAVKLMRNKDTNLLS